MDNLLVILIIALAFLYIFRHLFKGIKNRGTCDCGCSSCDDVKTCEDIQSHKSTDS